MSRAILFLALCVGGVSSASAAETDFGVRTVSGGTATVTIATHPTTANWTPVRGGQISLSAAAAIGARWGRVTSTYRSPEHNRRVGGVRNSYHIRGRAIDIARRPGVSHSQIAAAFRSAGYSLIESLDEGDHSHFAFGFGSVAPAVVKASKPAEITAWRVVSAPGVLR